MRCHAIAFFLGFLLDLILGDPYWLPHPIRLIGKLIAAVEAGLREEIGKTDKGGKRNGRAESRLRGKIGKINKGGKRNGRAEMKLRGRIREADRENHADTSAVELHQGGWSVDISAVELRRGRWLVVMVLVSVVAVAGALLWTAYAINPCVGVVMETVMTYQILAVKCLRVESMKVYRALQNADLEQARAAVSMIVGRDTAHLDAEGVAKAAVETVAENTSDGVIAPMLYLAVGGPVLGFFYKAVNTMDSMVGYKNDKYLYFGRTAAKLDDAVNFVPARVSACLMLISSALLGVVYKEFSGKGALKIYLRDRRKHASPNSAQTEAVCAGALGVRLAGDASYFGKIVKKPYIGDALRGVEHEDIRRANRLMYVAAWLCEVVCLMVFVFLLGAFGGV